ncbi:Lrp/AsnC family transcriptional regulator [Pelosinus propionicus]|uniref:Transcriptional regulator, AsnC family n=1 Tax=Pelosinus propionicus DSM 13327 TaxID=1123291 RepID=A0A1I4JWT0_9FIRM|nr:Lrp/AsnC family transcriptional regulator [Pelosinus propionicus]SFL71000.1 transcriptional regulator, AsnC family [Pelosinus propionicus DSM 13327]
MDLIDKKILYLLQSNARMSNANIAREIKLAPSVTLSRVRKLEEQGIITGYEAKLNHHELGLDMLAFVLIQVTGDKDIESLLIAIPGVQEVHNVAGDDCYLIKIRTRNTESLSKLLKEKVRGESISTKTIIVLTTLKETSKLTF